LRSPILPILGTLELIEYEFESDKKEIKLQREHFERIMRNTKRLERLASEILDVTKIDDQSGSVETSFCLHIHQSFV
jgi:signal transduction histidine kinase